MKTFLIFLLSATTFVSFAQTGGNVLYQADGQVPESAQRHWWSSNLTATGNRTHDAAKKYSKVNNLDYWQLNAGVITPSTMTLDSNSFTVTTVGTSTISADGGFAIYGGPGLNPALRLINGGDYLELDEDGGDIRIKTLSTDNSMDTVLVISPSHRLYKKPQAVFTTHTPSSASDTGTQGTIAWDANYIYVCTATNTWKRVAISTW